MDRDFMAFLMLKKVRLLDVPVVELHGPWTDAGLANLLHAKLAA